MNHVAVLAVYNYSQLYQHHYKQYQHNNSDQKANLLNFHQPTEPTAANFQNSVN